MLLERCHSCGFSLYAEKEKQRLYSCMGVKAVYCADSDACRTRYADERRRIRDRAEDERMSAGQLTRSYYIS